MSVSTSLMMRCQSTARLPSAFHQASLAIPQYPLILLGGERCLTVECFAQKYNMITRWPNPNSSELTNSHLALSPLVSHYSAISVLDTTENSCLLESHRLFCSCHTAYELVWFSKNNILVKQSFFQWLFWKCIDQWWNQEWIVHSQISSLGWKSTSFTDPSCPGSLYKILLEFVSQT